MKKLLALILAAALALSLVACGGGSGAGDTTNSEYGIGDTLSTDCIEVSITSYDVVTADAIKNNPNTKNGVTSSGDKEERLFLIDYLNGIDVDTYSEDDLRDLYLSTERLNDGEKAYFFIFYSAKNIGKEKIEAEPVRDGLVTTYLPFGNITIDYDDGYKFEYSSAFARDLDVLSDGYNDARWIIVPKEIAINNDKPLRAIISLPNSASNTDDRTEFIVNLR